MWPFLIRMLIGPRGKEGLLGNEAQSNHEVIRIGRYILKVSALELCDSGTCKSTLTSTECSRIGGIADAPV